MDNIYNLYQGDCLEIMNNIPDSSIDMILCDLPYGTTQNKWDSVIPLEPMWEQIKRIIKTNKAICLFANQPFTSQLVSSNINNYRYEWIWIKSKITGVLNAKRMPIRKHESIQVFSYGKLPPYYPQGVVECFDVVKQGGNSENYGDRNKKEYIKTQTNLPRDVIEFKSCGKTVHPTQKPVELLEYLIKTYTLEGETVLDFTMGSGSTGVAALHIDRKFIGIEKDTTYCGIAEKRIQDVVVKN